MNTLGKLFVLFVVVLGMAAVGITISHRSRIHDEVNSRAQIVPVEPMQVQVEHRLGRGSTSLSGQGASISVEVAADTASGNPDNLENPDEIRAWARSHPQYARGWLASAPEGVKRDTVAEIVCLQTAETNPAVAVALADGFGADCTNVVENLMVQWADQDLQAAYDWAATKPRGGQRDGLFSRIAFVESKTDPKDAARLVAEQIPPGQVQDEAAISVLYQWALKDPGAAMGWAQSFSAGALHDRAVNEVQNVIASNSR